MNEGQINQTEKDPKAVSTLVGVIVTNPGNPVAPVYKRVYDEELKKTIVKKVDEFDLYEFIQASKSSTDMAVLQKRFIELGEIPQVDPTLGSNDLTLFPSDIHGVYNMVNDVDNNFKKLPESIQKIFGNKENYLKALMDGTYQATLIKAFNAAKQTPVEPTTKETPNNE